MTYKSKSKKGEEGKEKDVAEEGEENNVPEEGWTAKDLRGFAAARDAEWDKQVHSGVTPLPLPYEAPSASLSCNINTGSGLESNRENIFCHLFDTGQAALCAVSLFASISFNMVA